MCCFLFGSTTACLGNSYKEQLAHKWILLRQQNLISFCGMTTLKYRRSLKLTSNSSLYRIRKEMPKQRTQLITVILLQVRVLPVLCLFCLTSGCCCLGSLVTAYSRMVLHHGLQKLHNANCSISFYDTDSICCIRSRDTEFPIKLSSQLGDFKNEIDQTQIILAVVVIAVKMYRLVTARKDFFELNSHLSDQQLEKLIFDCAFTSDSSQNFKDLQLKFQIKAKGIRLSDRHKELITPEIWHKLAFDTSFGCMLSQQKQFRSQLKTLGGFTMHTSGKVLSSILDKRNHQNYLDDTLLFFQSSIPWGYRGHYKPT